MSDVTRREALAILGAVPLAMALHSSPAAAARAVAIARRAAHESAGYTPEFFSPHEWRTVRVLVDLIIPRDERSGSATDAGVPEFIDFTMTDRPAMQTPVRGGLGWLDAESRRRHEAPFVELTAAQQTGILDDIAFPASARPGFSHGVAFFTMMRDLTASGFFSSRTGVDDLQYPGNRAVMEWTGCPDEAVRRLGVSYDIMQRRG